MESKQLIAILIVIAIGAVGIIVVSQVILPGTDTDDKDDDKKDKEDEEFFECLWKKYYGDTDTDTLYDMFMDSSDNIHLVGTTNLPSTHRLFLKYDDGGTLLQENASYGELDSTGNDGEVNVFVAEEDCVLTPQGLKCSTDLLKYNSSRQIEWGVYSLAMSGVIGDSDGNSYLSVRIDKDVYIAKFNSTGDLKWNSSWTTTEQLIQNGYDKVVDSQGNVYVAGQVHLATGFENMFLIKFNSTGDLQWEDTWGDTARNDYFFTLNLDSFGNSYVSGIKYVGGSSYELYVRKYNSTGDLQWQYTRSALSINDEIHDIVFDSSNNTIILGHSGSAPDTNVFIMKLNDQGNFVWIKYWEGYEYEVFPIFVLGGDDSIYVAGTTRIWGTSDNDLFLVKFTSSGSCEGEYFWGGSGTEYVSKILIDASDKIYLAGTTTTYGSGGTDIFLLKVQEIPS